MAQDKRTFLGGMNKDVDNRLIKNPDYIDALNIRVASSTDGTIGAVENIEGNEEVPFEFYSEGQDSLFVNDNGLYQQVNPATVFYQKVIRIQGWESVNQNYSFTLYSLTDNGDSSGYGTIPIGQFSWTGNEARTATTQYLYSQFSGVGGLNTGINVYDINTNAQYTASVKLLSFGQNSLLSGGYLDIVIQCDVAGVDFHLGASANYESDGGLRSAPGPSPSAQFTYTFDQDSSIPITSSGDASISLLSSFETGGLYNADANDDGILISPEGQIYEMGNRTVWKITFEGDQPTSPTAFDDVTIYSYRENLVTALSNMEYDSLPFLTIKSDFFDTNAEFEFDSTKTSFSKYLIDQFSEDKAVLCNGLPLDFYLGSDNFFLTFSGQDEFSSDSDSRSVIIYGPVGVNFKLALADSSESLHNVLDPNQDVEDSIDTASIFNNNSIIRLQNLQIAQNSINITDSITNHINDLETNLSISEGSLAVAINNLEEQSVQYDNLQQDLEDQIALTSAAEAQVDGLQADNSTLQNSINQLITDYQNLEGVNDFYLQNLNNLDQALITLNEAVTTLNFGLTETMVSIPQISIDGLETQIPDVGAPVNFNELASNTIQLITSQVVVQNSYNAFIAEFNETFEDEINDTEFHTQVTDTINLIIVVEDIIANITSSFEGEIGDIISDYESQINTLNQNHANTLAAAASSSEDELEDITNAYNAHVEQLNDDHAAQIANLNTTIGDLNIDVSSLQEQLDNSRATIDNLQAIIDNLVISDLISRQVLDNTHSTFTSIDSLYNNTLSLYNTLSVTNQVIHEEDFGTVSSFKNDWNLYDNVLQPSSSPNKLLSYGHGNTIVLGENPSGYEFTGYLKMPTNPDTYSAVRLPWSKFDNSSAWQVGSEMTISIEFNVVNTSTGPGANPLPSGYEVLVTNEWDNGPDGFVDQPPHAFQESYDVTINSSVNPNPFTHTFEVVNDGGSSFDNRLKNITIIAPPTNSDIEVRITNVRVSNDSQEMFAFSNIEPANNTREDYLILHSQIENVIVGFDASGEESIEDFFNTTDDYQEFLGKLIPGYTDGNSSLPALLDAFTAEVVAFTSSVQDQFASRLELYVNALGADTSNLGSNINNAFQQIIEQSNEINDLQAEINILNDQLSTGLDSMTGLLDGPNFVTTLYNIVGPEPALGQPLFGGTTGQANYSVSTSYYTIPSEGVGFIPRWRINGSVVEGDTITLLSSNEYNNLKTSVWSATNNIIYYITNRFQNNQAIDIEIPEGQYPTQKCHIVFANFDNNPNLSTELITDNIWEIKAVDSNNTINGVSTPGTSSNTENFNFIITQQNPITRIVKNNIVEVDKYYELSYDIDASNHSSGLATDTRYADGSGQEQPALDTTVGSHTTTFYSKNTYFIIKRSGYNTNITISNISLKEITPYILDGSVNPTIEAGLNISGSLFTQQGFDFFTSPVLQMLIYFDQTEGDNVTFSEDLYLERFDENTSGFLFYFPTNGAYMKAISAHVNIWNH